MPQHRYVRMVYGSDLVPHVPFDSDLFEFKHLGPFHWANALYHVKVTPPQSATCRLAFSRGLCNIGGKKRFGESKHIKVVLAAGFNSAGNFQWQSGFACPLSGLLRGVVRLATIEAYPAPNPAGRVVVHSDEPRLVRLLRIRFFAAFPVTPLLLISSLP